MIYMEYHSFIKYIILENLFFSNALLNTKKKNGLGIYFLLLSLVGREIKIMKIQFFKAVSTILKNKIVIFKNVKMK